MSCDQTKISNIEALLNSNPSSISTNDLIYYLKCNSNNSILDPNNLDSTTEYLNKINISFAYENVFVNTSNYGSIVTSIIGLLIPFYYFFPRFYKIGFIGTIIGIMSFFNLYSKTNNLYSPFFSNIGLVFISLTMLIYIIFFILLNKLNHYSLFFISAILSFLIINYIVRFILTIPTKVNKWNKYNASMNSNNSSNYTEYNALLETACFQVMNRFNMKLPSGNMLYSYLTVFEIGENPNKTKIADFLTNMFAPFISIFLLWFFGYFLAQLKDETIQDTGEEINLFPLIGIHDDSKKYYTCQANYILPKELNLGLLIHDHIDKYNFDDTLYNKVEKALTRISKDLLLKYNPKFFKLEVFDFKNSNSEDKINAKRINNEVNAKRINSDNEVQVNAKRINSNNEAKVNAKRINDDDDNDNEYDYNSNLNKDNKIFSETIYKELENNKIFQEILKLLKKNNIFNEILKKNKNTVQSGGVRIDDNENNENKGQRISSNNEIKVNSTRIEDNNNNKTEVNATRINSNNEIKINNASRIEEDDTYISKIKEIINEQILPYKRKSEMLDLVDHITNTLRIINKFDKDYDKDWILATEALLDDKEIKDEQKPKLKEILTDYIDKFKNNLKIKDKTLFGYHYNIVGYKLFGDKVRVKSNDIFSFILRLLSTWLLFAKPIGSPWVITKYIMSSSEGFKKLLKNLSGTSLLWKYFSMGLDRSYFEEIYKNVENNTENSIFKNPTLLLSKGWNLLLTILIFILLLMIFYFYNSTNFGLTSSPSWYNMIYQIIFIIIITWNLVKYRDDRIPNNEKLLSLLVLNRWFLFGSIILIIFIFIIMLIIGAFQGK
jgi:hypothetical protein